MRKVLIIGADSLLGQELAGQFKTDGNYKVIAWGEKDLDTSREKEVDKRIQIIKPELIINTNQYRQMDECERDKKSYERAKSVNSQAPEYIARVAEKIKSIYVHYSADIVFNGEPDVPEPDGCTHTCDTCSLHQGFTPLVGFRENDIPKPINKLGKTFLAGEKAIQSIAKKYYILRTGHLFGHDDDFVQGILKASQKEKEIGASDGETTSFTYIPDLAKKTKEIVDSRKPFGVYHVTNTSQGTWYEMAATVIALSQKKVQVAPIYTDDSSKTALRPFYSVLLNTKLNPLRDWREALMEYLKK